MCRSMVDIQSPTAEIRRGKKRKKERRQKPQDKNIMPWICASFGLPECTAQPKRQINQFSHFCTVHSLRQKVPILYNGRPFLPKLSRLMGDLDPYLTHDSLGHSEPTIQTASRSVQPFSHRWPKSVPILYIGTRVPFPVCPVKWP